MYQFLDVEEFSPVRVIATVAKSYLHSPTPIFIGEVIAAIQQLRNYQDILLQNTVREHFRNEGIEYFYPEMRLVIGRKPNMSVNQWRKLKSSYENNIKILTYDLLLEEMRSRLQSYIDLKI